MASGSEFIPSTMAANPVTNGHISFDHDVTMNGDDSPAHSAVAPSSPQHSPFNHSSPSAIQSDIHTPESDQIDVLMTDSGSDVDAEGSEDADYTHIPPDTADALELENAPTPSSSTSSSRSNKRKLSIEDEEDWRANPELYGVRRSGRARNNRAIIDSPSENDSDSDVVRRPRNKRRRAVNGNTTATYSKPATPTSVSDESDSDNFVTNIRHKPTKKQKRHQKNVAAGLAPPSQSYQRFSTRQRGKVTTYNEEEEDSFEDDSDAVTPNYQDVEEDNSPKIGEVLEFRLPEGSKLSDEDIAKSKFEYRIKWENEAYIHATWTSYEDLGNLRRSPKLNNFYIKIVVPFIHAELGVLEGNKDDKEILNLQYEEMVDQINLKQQVERVIGRRQGEEETEYFVKWKRVDYNGCTWETASFIGSLVQTEIDNFLNRSQKLPTSDKTLSNITSKRSYKPWKEQPSYIKGGKLRDFQVMGVNFLAMNWCRQRNVILADEMGLGKTVQTVAFTSWIMHEMKQEGPFLIVVPLSTLPAWQETYALWAPDMNVVAFTDDAKGRQVCADYEILLNGDPRKVKCNVVLTTYEVVMRSETFLSSIKWQFVAVDEAHRLKNRESLLYKTLVGFKIPNRLLITGTPMQNSLEELRALLDFLNPGEITAPDDFDSLPPEEAAQVLSRFKEDIRPYMLRRVKEEVEKDLPPKTEKIIRVELAQLQIEYYQNIITRNYAALNAGAGGHKQSLLNIMMELKKISNHPFVFHGAEDRVLKGSTKPDEILRAIITSSGKMMLLDKLLTKMKQDGHRVLIFCQLVSMLDILSDYMSLRGYNFQRLDGTVPSNARRRSIDHYNAPGSEDFVFLLSTRAGGLGINLMTADTVVLFDSDWNPHPDLQAMSRAHRIGQTKPVSVYRFVSADTIEEEILERARNKLMLEFLTIQSGMTEDEQKRTIQKHDKLVEAPKSAEEITEILKRRSQKMFEKNDNQKKLEELDIDAILETAEEHQTKDVQAIQTSDGGLDFMKSLIITNVKFDGSWDDIIPKEQLEQLQEEEKKREEEELFRKLQEEEGPRKRNKPSGTEEKSVRAAKKKAKRNAAAMAAAQENDSEGDVKDKDSDDDDDPVSNDPKRPLKTKEVRNLIKGVEHWGAFDDADVQSKLIDEFRLGGRDKEVLQAEYDALLRRCHEEVKLQKPEGQQSVAKKSQKAVIFEYKGVKRINAETILDRVQYMPIVRQFVAKASDIKKFRIPDTTKPAEYSCPWGAREDGMLLAGIARHGFGGWLKIRDDEELEMQDRMFLEENRKDNKKGENETRKAPGAVHLVRRGQYLLEVVKNTVSNGTNSAARKALENHHRNTKKALVKDRVQSLAKSNGTPGGSPAPSGGSAVRKIKKERNRTFSHSGAQPSIERAPSPDGNGKVTKRRNTIEEEDATHKRRKLSSESTPDARRPTGESADREKVRKEKPRHREDKDRRRPDPRRDAYSSRRDLPGDDRRPGRRDNIYSERRDRNDRYSRDRSSRSRSRSRSPRRHGGRDGYRDRYDDRRDDRRLERRDERRDDRRSTHYDRDEWRDERRLQDKHRSLDRSHDRHDRAYSRESPDRSRPHRDEFTDKQRLKSQHSSREHAGKAKALPVIEKNGNRKGPSVPSRCPKQFDQHQDLLQNLRNALTLTIKEEKAKAMRASMAALGRFIPTVGGNGVEGSKSASDELWTYIITDVLKSDKATPESLQRVANKAIEATQAA